MFCFVLFPVWSWLVLTTTSSECSTVIRSVTWLWRRPGRTASLGRSWNRGRCVWAESVAKMKSVWTAWTLARKFSTLPGILLRTSSLWQPPITFTYSKIRSTSTTVPPPHVPEKREKEEQNAAAQQEIATCLLWWETGSYLWCREKYGQMLAMCKDAARLSQTSSILPCTIILPLLSICISPSVNLFIYRIYSFLCWKEMPDSLNLDKCAFSLQWYEEFLIRQKTGLRWHPGIGNKAFTKKTKQWISIPFETQCPPTSYEMSDWFVID